MSVTFQTLEFEVPDRESPGGIGIIALRVSRCDVCGVVGDCRCLSSEARWTADSNRLDARLEHRRQKYAAIICMMEARRGS